MREVVGGKATGISARKIGCATLAVLAGAAFWPAAVARAGNLLDVFGVKAAAQELPNIYGLLRRPGDTTGGPMSQDSDSSNAFQAFLDTGTSGIILSSTYSDPDALGVNPELDSHNNPVTFSDVAVNGSVVYNVSEPLELRVGRYTGEAFDDVFDTATTNAYFNQVTSNARLQLDTTPVDPFSFDEPLNLIGMPALLGKVMVVDARLYNHLVGIDLDTFAIQYDDSLTKLADFPQNAQDAPFPQIQAWVYNKNDPTNHSATPMFDPGIPHADQILKLSYGDFGKFTVTSPSEPGIQPPTLAHNPFIGPVPFSNTPDPNTPGITLKRTLTNTTTVATTTGSWLLDTGAQVSFMSSVEARTLGVEQTFDGDGNLTGLIDLNTNAAPFGEFSLDLGGAGGDAGTMYGFTVDELDLPTTTGIIAFHDVQIGVLDIVLDDGTNSYTLDGDFGMNLLLPSYDVTGDNGTSSQFDFFAFDEPAGELLLTDVPTTAVPEPACVGLIAAGCFVLLRRQRRGIAGHFESLS